jgi:hypothetical protein
MSFGICDLAIWRFCDLNERLAIGVIDWRLAIGFDSGVATRASRIQIANRQSPIK